MKHTRQMGARLLALACAIALCLALAPAAWAGNTGLAEPAAVQTVAIGGASALLDPEGGLWVWGGSAYNLNYGLLADGTVTGASATPRKILDNVASFSIGYQHAAAVKEDGSLWMWGSNQYGQLGTVGTGNATYLIESTGTELVLQTTPIKVMDGVASVSCGDRHTGVVKTDGSLWMWGDNRYGQLGTGGGGNASYLAGNALHAMQTVPVKVMDGVVSVSCGTGFTGAIKQDGSLWMWGDNRYGELGNNKVHDNAAAENRVLWQSTPVKSLDHVAAVVCDDAYTMAIQTDGTLVACGSNYYGQLGNGGKANGEGPLEGYPAQTVWTEIMDNVAAVSCGSFVTGILDTDGTLWLCGGTQGGPYLGLGTSYEESLVPVPVMEDVATMAIGQQTRMAVTKDGGVWMWGKTNISGLGTGEVLVPTQLEGMQAMLPNGAPAQTEKEESSALRESGSTDLAKLSKEEIVQLLADNPNTMPDQVFTQTPSVNPPYAAGAVSQEALQRATDRLNALRRLAGLPAVSLDASLSANAQYGAVLSAHNGALSHYPTQPTDMDSSFFQQAYEAVSTSNLSAGRTLCNAPDGLMNDSDARNVAVVGHRRWQLNPTMGKVGFGYAENSQSIYRTFVVEKVFDTSGDGVDYDFIGWPASGNFPGNLTAFTGDSAWSITLNPGLYQTPVQSELTITLTRLSDGAVWTLDGSDSYTPADSGRYLNVDTTGYGVSNCIIFRPDGINKYQGVYQVTIDGLKTKSGQPADFCYQVDFFDTDTYTSQSTTQEQPSDWACSEVTQAVAAGLVPASLQSDYTQAATRAEFCALAVQLYETATGRQVTGRTTFTDTTDVNVEKAAYLGIVTGVGGGAFRPNDPLNREQAAVMLARLASAVGSPLPQRQADFGDLSSVSYWAVEAVGQMQGSGIMNGVGGGQFAPAQSYSREQSMVTMLHLYQWLGV